MPQEKPQPEAFSLYASVTQTTCNLFTRFEKLEPNSFPIKEMYFNDARTRINGRRSNCYRILVLVYFYYSPLAFIVSIVNNDYWKLIL